MPKLAKSCFKKGKGFTLLELMTTIVILVIVISGLLYSYVVCILLNESNANLITATNDAQMVLEQMKSLAYNNIATYVPPSLTNLQDEAVTINRSIGSKIAQIRVNVSWTERQRQRNIEIVTRIPR
ncbi:MAG: type II secretion system protein [Candidatus Omnitrophota bacterium]|jgi:prepilin-type N-terminal cleavage/methylation domain-containing protein|nr:MAG: type II secretion system protein [Candidatus Omnitrophota bacterium]